MIGDDFTLQELMIARMAREFSGEVIATGATYLGEIAARLAKHLHDPRLVIVGGGSHASFDCDPDGNFLNGEWSSAASSHMVVGWEELFDMIAQSKLQIFIGPVQIDRFGSANISAIGKWEKPRVQLIGARGLPDDLWGNEKFFYHINKHSRNSFVEAVDIVCSLGFGEKRGALNLRTGVPGIVVSDLGVFGWNVDSGHMTIESLHPGVTFDMLQERTGFEWPREQRERLIPRTASPTAEELYLIRHVIDPSGWRRIDSGDCPPDLLQRLCAAEKEDRQSPRQIQQVS